MKYKRLLVTGCPRSGTSFYRNILKKKGLRLGHEYVDEDGTVSGFFYGAHDWYPYNHKKNGERRQDYIFGEAHLIVRHPLECIPSLAVLLRGGETVPARQWYSEFYDITINPESDCVAEAAAIWAKSYNYLLTHEHFDQVVRLEDLIEEYPDEPRPNPSFKDEYKKALTWEELHEICGEKLALDILDFACIFGYEEGEHCV